MLPEHLSLVITQLKFHQISHLPIAAVVAGNFYIQSEKKKHDTISLKAGN